MEKTELSRRGEQLPQATQARSRLKEVSSASGAVSAPIASPLSLAHRASSPTAVTLCLSTRCLSSEAHCSDSLDTWTHTGVGTTLPGLQSAGMWHFSACRA